MKTQNKKIVVTGCAGFIGSNLVDKLLSNNHRVIGIDNLSTGQNKFLGKAFKNKNFDFVNMNLSNLNLLKKKIKNIEIVYHLAANSDVKSGFDHPKKDLEQNVICTFNLLESMRYNSVKKIAFTSTAPIYGDTKLIPTPENAPLSNQTSLYGASKLYCEGLIQSYCEGYDFQSWIFRFVSILGPRYPHGHIFDFYKQLMIKDKKTLKILGDGYQKKSYLHVSDCISAMLIAIRKSKKKINIFNLGCNEYLNVRTSAKLICKKLMIKPKFIFTGGKRGWVGDQPFVFLNTKKIRNLKWKNKINIQNSILDTVDWLKSNHWIFKKRK